MCDLVGAVHVLLYMLCLFNFKYSPFSIWCSFAVELSAPSYLFFWLLLFSLLPTSFSLLAPSLLVPSLLVPSLLLPVLLSLLSQVLPFFFLLLSSCCWSC